MSERGLFWNNDWNGDEQWSTCSGPEVHVLVFIALNTKTIVAQSVALVEIAGHLVAQNFHRESENINRDKVQPKHLNDLLENDPRSCLPQQNGR